MTDDNSFLCQTLKKNLKITLENLEESGKILGKDLWVRAHSKENTIVRFIEKGDGTG